MVNAYPSPRFYKILRDRAPESSIPKIAASCRLVQLSSNKYEKHEADAERQTLLAPMIGNTQHFKIGMSSSCDCSLLGVDRSSLPPVGEGKIMHHLPNGHGRRTCVVTFTIAVSNKGQCASSGS